ncbi:MAG: MBL fold metallo-hydrolase [Ferrimicrobium sp.]
MVDLVIVPTLELGDRSYIVHDGRLAVVVDTQRDIDRTMGFVTELGLEVVAVGETHMHNDYVTGGFALASELGVDYLIYGDEAVSFARRGVHDREVLRYGELSVTVLHTPGHTPTHISFVVHSDRDGGAPVVLSGGSLLYGSVGRTDLIGPEMTEALTRSQYRSVHRLADELPDTTLVMPTHGFGSFCSSISVAEVGDSTLGGEKRINVAFQYANEDAFVEGLMKSYDPYPAYYSHMGPANLKGPAALRVDEVKAVDVTEALKLQKDGVVLLDIRPRGDFLAAHAPGVINFEWSNVFSTYFGWHHDYGTSIVLVADSQKEAAEVVYSLGRIGIGDVVGFVLADALHAVTGTESVRRIDFAAYAGERESTQHQLLDLRNPSEHRLNRLPGAVQVPVYELLDHVYQLDRETPIYIHCAGGYRASAGASLLKRDGFKVVVIDDSIDIGVGLLGSEI